MGEMITLIRNKLLVRDAVDFADSEQRFLLFAINDVFVTSHSAIVKSQLGLSIQVLRPDTTKEVVSQIDQDIADFSGTYLTEWQIMQSCMTKLGMVAPPPYQPLKAGPDGDPNGISTPTHHDINDGTGYNHR